MSGDQETTLVRTRFGSHLYGTDTPSSDVDLKAVVIPAPRDIILQRAFATRQRGPAKQVGEKNQAGDVDEEVFSLHRYLELLGQNQTVALDVLFAPRAMMIVEPHPIWREIFEQRHRLVSRNTAAILGYCRQQANKYGIKGSRVAAVRDLTTMLGRLARDHGPCVALSHHKDALLAYAGQLGREHFSLVPIKQPGREDPLMHVECCGRKVPFNHTVGQALTVFGKVLAQYGERAWQAERNVGVDWKALSHAVRIGHQALEFLQDGFITFPLRNRDHVRAIKSGSVEYAAVAEEIETMLDRVERAEAGSWLPERQDTAYAEDLVERAYRSVL